MNRRNTKGRFSKHRLERLIGELSSLTKELCPEAAIEVEPGIGELDVVSREKV